VHFVAFGHQNNESALNRRFEMKVKAFFCVAVLAIAFIIAAPIPASAQSGYTFELIPPPGALSNSYPFKVNILNHSLVRFYDRQPGFLWDGSQTVGLPKIPGGMTCLNMGLNDRDQVVGGCFRAEGSWDAHVPPFVPAIWNPGNSRPQALKWLPGDHYGAGWDINNSGMIAGNSGRYAGTNEQQDAVVWRSANAAPKRLKPVPGMVITNAFALTEGGAVAGFSGSSFDEQWGAYWANPDAEPVQLPRLDGIYAVAESLNETGQIVGVSEDAGTCQAVLWEKSDGVWTVTRLAPESVYSEATSINNSGQIVGLYMTDLGEFHAVLWQPKAEGGFSRIDLSSAIPGWFFDEAFSINDAGVIAVEGIAYEDPSMTYQPGLLFPAEE
jgi:hypothetical protein